MKEGFEEKLSELYVADFFEFNRELQELARHERDKRLSEQEEAALKDLFKKWLRKAKEIAKELDAVSLTIEGSVAWPPGITLGLSFDVEKILG